MWALKISLGVGKATSVARHANPRGMLLLHLAPKPALDQTGSGELPVVLGPQQTNCCIAVFPAVPPHKDWKAKRSMALVIGGKG